MELLLYIFFPLFLSRLYTFFIFSSYIFFMCSCCLQSKEISFEKWIFTSYFVVVAEISLALVVFLLIYWIGNMEYLCLNSHMSGTTHGSLRKHDIIVIFILILKKWIHCNAILFFFFCFFQHSLDKKEILHKVSGTFPSGNLIAIMGPSGAGITTRFNKSNNCLNDLLLVSYYYYYYVFKVNLLC